MVVLGRGEGGRFCEEKDWREKSTITEVIRITSKTEKEEFESLSDLRKQRLKYREIEKQEN